MKESTEQKEEEQTRARRAMITLGRIRTQEEQDMIRLVYPTNN